MFILRHPALALGIVLALAGPAAADIELPEIEFESYTLDNGLQVILHEDHSTPIVGVNTWYHVGSKNERPGRSGFAHLFEHMMFQGSEHQDGEYFGPIQSVGGVINGSTSEDRTNYWQVVPANHLERVLLLEADRMGWLLPAMTEEKLANQQDVVRNERRQSEGQPYSKWWLNLNELFYPKGHPYDHSVIGVHEDLENATLEDVKDFFRTYYVPNNATLSIAGDIDVEQTKAWVEEYYGAIPPGNPVDEIAVWIPEITHEKRVTMQDRVQLTRIYWAWHTPPMYHEGDADLSLAATILGGGDTSRLERILVNERKLAQDVRMRQDGQQVVSLLTLQVTLRPGVDAAEVERVVDEELARFAAKGPTAKELEQAQSRFEAGFVKGVQRIGSWGGINDRLNRYNHYVGTPDYFRQDYERHMSRTRETVREQFARWAGPGRMVLTIEPFAAAAPATVADVDRTRLPEGGPAPVFAAPEVVRRTLANGAHLAVLRRDELPLVSLELVFHSGSAAEPAGLEGLAGLAADLHLEGAGSRDRFEFRGALENLGTDLSVRTEDDFTVFRLTALSSHLGESFALFADAILRPTFPEDVFRDERERKLVSIRQSQDQPRAIAQRASRRVLYGPDHPYGRTGEGTEASVAAISLADVRTFSGTNYAPGNATLVAVGDVDPDGLVALWDRHFGAWNGDAVEQAAIPTPALPAGRTIWLIDKPGDTQSTISIVQPGIARGDERWEAVVVMNRVLGGFFSSRLNLNLREDKGWTYGVRSRAGQNVGVSSYTVGGRVQREVTAPALVEFLAEIEGVAGKRPITAEEMEFAKDSVILSYPQDFETNGELAGALAGQAAYGLSDDDFARYPERIAAVTLDEVHDVAAAFLRPDNLDIVVVGDLERIEAAVRELKVGATVRYADREGTPIEKETELSTR
jgi:zinc protease